MVPGMDDILTGYSKALYSSWFYYKPARLMLDAGEGIIQRLGKRIFGIRKIFLSHGHEDHIAGLPSLVNLRNLSMGDRDVPVRIYHAEGDLFIDFLREYLDNKQKARLRYNLEWQVVRPGEAVEVETSRRSTRVVPFEVSHTPRWQSLGYRVEERRHRLKPEFEGLGADEVKRLVRERGKGAIVDRVWHPVLVYTGDSRPLEDLSLVRRADILLIDATFLDEEESVGSRHGHIQSSFAIAAEAGVKHLILFHLSERYTAREVRRAIREAAKRYGMPSRLGYFYEGRYYELHGPEAKG
jgi:ribonuclease Z